MKRTFVWRGENLLLFCFPSDDDKSDFTDGIYLGKTESPDNYLAITLSLRSQFSILQIQTSSYKWDGVWGQPVWVF